jgi:hypothetical protein
MIRHVAPCVLSMLLILSATAGSGAAQGRGRGGSAGGPARSRPNPGMARGGAGPAVRPPVTAAQPAFNRHIMSPASRIGVRPRRQVIVAPTYWGFYDPYAYGWAPPFYSASPYATSNVETSYVAPSPSPSQVDLANQVERLTREVERLRQDQADAALRQSTPPPRTAEPPPAPITLVFRDGRRLSIQSYAIVRQTLWIVDERMSTRIDLNDLDLPATQQANLGRVLLLPVPAR